MVCEGKHAYEGLSLGIWKVIWVVSEGEEIILEKSLFIELYGWYLWAKNG
jgi:hypothetical protein